MLLPQKKKNSDSSFQNLSAKSTLFQFNTVVFGIHIIGTSMWNQVSRYLPAKVCRATLGRGTTPSPHEFGDSHARAQDLRTDKVSGLLEKSFRVVAVDLFGGVCFPHVIPQMMRS